MPSGAFLRSGELLGGGGGRHRPQQGIGFPECGSRDTDPPAPCPDTHQNAHHRCSCSLASPLHLFFLVWLWNSCHFFLTAPQSHRPQGLEGDIFWAMACQIRFFNTMSFLPFVPPNNTSRWTSSTNTAISPAVKEGDLLFRLLAAFSILTCVCLATGGVYICANGLDNYFDTPVSCDYTHTHTHTRVWGDHRALCVIYALIKWWVIDLPGID